MIPLTRPEDPGSSVRVHDIPGRRTVRDNGSLNEFTRYGFPKDYDAVVQAERGGRQYRFALEYERSAKTPDRYANVRQAVEKESELDCVVYLVPAYPLLTYVASFF